MWRALTLVGFLLCASALTLKESNVFREDYTFKKDAGGWLKFHATPANWSDARVKCHQEGAILASLLTDQLTAAILTAINGTSEIWTGIHATFPSNEFYSDEGELQDYMTADWEDTEDKEMCIGVYNDGEETMSAFNCTDLMPFTCYNKTEQM